MKCCVQERLLDYRVDLGSNSRLSVITYETAGKQLNFSGLQLPFHSNSYYLLKAILHYVLVTFLKALLHCNSLILPTTNSNFIL